MDSSIPTLTLPKLLLQLRAVLEEVVLQGRAFDMRGIAPEMQDSALNLAQYLALRRRDLRPLQQQLAALGLSSLGRVETHVEPSLGAVLAGRSSMRPAIGSRSTRAACLVRHPSSVT